MLCDGVHVDCNATVGGHTLVPAGTKIRSGEYYAREKVEVNDLFFDLKNRMATVRTREEL
jgi:hypothetical protein